jgi:hypothetical protein
MAYEIKSLFGGQFSTAEEVLALEGSLANVVSQCREFEGGQVTAVQAGTLA